MKPLKKYQYTTHYDQVSLFLYRIVPCVCDKSTSLTQNTYFGHFVEAQSGATIFRK
jgi:hypothetical protein